MSGVNQVNLIGRLGADPEVRYTAAGDPVANLSLATSERWNDRATGEAREETEWHRVVLFGSPAKTASEYLGKGREVAIVGGKLKTRKWTDKDGADRYTTEVVVQFPQQLCLIGGAPESASSRPQAQVPPNNRHLGGQPPRTPSQQAEAKAGDPFDDDIPF